MCNKAQGYYQSIFDRSILEMTDKQKSRQHKATYARDKKKGGYLIRVVGPHAPAFVGKEVPITRNDGTESMEKLTKLIHSGTDDGKVNKADTGKPYALYQFEARPREDEEVTF